MIGIVAAHGIELHPVIRRLREARRYRGVVYGQLRAISVAVTRIGQGWARAQASTARFLDLTQCTAAIITGFAGATHPDLSVGDVVMPEAVLDLHQDEELVNGPRWQSPLRIEELRAKVAGRSGVLGTVRDLIIEPWDKERLGIRTGIVAVDLESAAAVAQAQSRGIPWVVTRVVLDPMRRPLGVVSWWHALVLAVSVKGWGRLGRFAVDLAVAQRRLGESVSLAVEEMQQIVAKRKG